jgi:NAD(P)-dependent dehydrogenase (short-subunit alcohol dehydrogenase family)
MRSALITGTSTGIGLETALLFARRGYRVHAGARNPDASQGLQRGVAEGLPIVPVALDVDRDDSVSAAVAQVGAIDVLINNAGIGAVAPVELMPMEEIRAFFETNFFGAVRMMQAILPAMRERRSGAIVNVTSMMGRITLPCHGYYAATKFALAAVTETLAMEVAPFGIRVASIEPGVILTPIWSKGPAPALDDARYRQGLSRLMQTFMSQMEGGTPADVVAAAIYQAATENGPIHVLVGEDAEVLVSARNRTTADVWASTYAEPDEHRFAEGLTGLCGVDFLNPPSLHARMSTSPPSRSSGGPVRSNSSRR